MVTGPILAGAGLRRAVAAPRAGHPPGRDPAATAQSLQLAGLVHRLVAELAGSWLRRDSDCEGDPPSELRRAAV